MNDGTKHVAFDGVVHINIYSLVISHSENLCTCIDTYITKCITKKKNVLRVVFWITINITGM